MQCIDGRERSGQIKIAAVLPPTDDRSPNLQVESRNEILFDRVVKFDVVFYSMKPDSGS